MNLVIREDNNRGSCVCEATAGTGSGKTAILLWIAEQYTKNYPNDKVFWNNSFFSPSQFMRFKKGLYDIYIEKNQGIYFKDINTDKPVDVEAKHFNNFRELYEMAKPGRISVIVIKDRRRIIDWMNYIRKKPGWIHTFVDEASDVFPSDQKGEDYHKIKNFAEDVKEFRKCRKGFYYCTQSITDLDWHIRGKRNVVFYGPGSVVDKKGGNRLYQAAVDHLQKNQNGLSCYVCIPGAFGLVQFKKIYGPAPDIQAFYDDEEEENKEEECEEEQ